GRARIHALLDDLGGLALFSEIVEQRSFTAGARRSGTTTSAASKRIANLERKLGVRLIERTTRRAVPSEAGLLLYERCQALLEQASELEQALASHRGQLAGTLRVSAPVTFGQLHIVPLVTTFCARYPELRVQLSLNDQSVDLLASGVDVAIRAGRTHDASSMSRKVGDDRRVLCATPEYLQKSGVPRVPNDLLGHRCLRHPLMAPSGGWAFITPEGSVTIPVRGPIEIDNVAALREVALTSAGLTLLPAYAVGGDLRSGRLVSVLDAFIPKSPPFRALWLAGKQPVPRVVAFVDYIASELPKRL
ncbi:MAG TPA: LysR substrate-binding domain-containing protein, partial [Polyangiaceae bacterium]|nr:LysR substrate-binding domain-containing protein [Polyangiaceae bacterium]